MKRTTVHSQNQQLFVRKYEGWRLCNEKASQTGSQQTSGVNFPQGETLFST